MRILVLAACLLLGALPPVVAHASGDAGDFVNQFHTLCPRDARTEGDVENAVLAAGAERTRVSLAALEARHDAPADFPAGAALTPATRHWLYKKNGWVGIVTLRGGADGGVKELHCKVQMSSADGASFVWLLQYASGAVPTTHAFADGVHAYRFRDAKAPNAYYLFWRDLPPAVPGASPTVVTEYVIRDGAPAPGDLVTPEQQALTRLERFCLNPTASVVAAKVAAVGTATIDAEAKARLLKSNPDYRRDQSQSNAWIMHDADEWRLQTSAATYASATLGAARDCNLRVAGVHGGALAALLAGDKRWRLEKDAPYNGGRARHYRIAGDRILIYFTRAASDGPLEDYTLSVVEGGPFVIRPVRR